MGPQNFFRSTRTALMWGFHVVTLQLNCAGGPYGSYDVKFLIFTQLNRGLDWLILGNLSLTKFKCNPIVIQFRNYIPLGKQQHLINAWWKMAWKNWAVKTPFLFLLFSYFEAVKHIALLLILDLSLPLCEVANRAQ